MLTPTQTVRLAEIYAVNARIEGMKADNAQSYAVSGNLVYTGIDFDYCANEILELSRKINEDI